MKKRARVTMETRGLVIDISNKKRKMVATGLGRSKDDEDIDEVDTDKTSSQLAITKVRKRIFDNEVNDNDEEKDNEEDINCGRSWMIEKRKKDNETLLMVACTNSNCCNDLYLNR